MQTDPLLSERLAEFGYPEEKLSTGLTFHDAARDLYIEQQVEYGVRIEATGVVGKLYRELRTKLRSYRGIARIALQKQTGLYEQLRLTGEVLRRREALLQQARHFYLEIPNHDHVR